MPDTAVAEAIPIPAESVTTAASDSPPLEFDLELPSVDPAFAAAQSAALDRVVAWANDVELVAELKSKLWLLARQAGDEAQEYVQAVLETHVGLAIKDPQRVLGIEKPFAFLLRSAQRKAMSRLRHQKVAASHFGELAVEAHSRSVVHSEGRLATSALMRAMIAKLPPQQKAIVIMQYYLDLPAPDIAATLGISEGTVKSNNARARTRLARELASVGIMSFADAIN